MRALFTFVVATGVFATGSLARAGECTSGFCGTPDQSGGGCGCGCGSILVAMTDRGDTYQFGDDFDGDGIEDAYDNCPYHTNYEQSDGDGDVVGDACDVCPSTSDPAQSDVDLDGDGDLCDGDIDGDLTLNGADNCPTISNFSQTDNESDGIGDACDDNDDTDGLLDFEDPCRLSDDNSGTCSDDDPDGDQVASLMDNCPYVQQESQLDTDGDGDGDACDADIDEDGLENSADNCAAVANPTQTDLDGDGLGDNGSWGSGLPGSCDQQECYVIPGSADCLSPDGAFRIGLVQIALPRSGMFRVGDVVRLPILTNRLHEVHAWTARLEKLPEDSDGGLFNARGSASTEGLTNRVGSCLRQSSDGTCAESSYIKLVPDAPGDYVVKVTTELPAGDPLGINSAAAAMVTIRVAGAADEGGCSATGASGGLVALVLGLFALGGQRQRRARQ